MKGLCYKKNSKKTNFIFLSLLVAFSVCLLWWRRDDDPAFTEFWKTHKKKTNFRTRPMIKHSNPMLDSLSIFRKTNICDELMENFKSYKMSPTYETLWPTIRKEQLKVFNADEDGYSTQVISELVILHHIARQPFVKTICETGFNYGHSSFNFLSANSYVQVYSFDLGNHVYAHKMNKTLHSLFPDNRLHVTFGNSIETVPQAISSGFLPLCDVVFVDGGHTYSVAKSDIYHLGMHTNENNLIIFDDHPTNWGGAFGKAWDEVLSGNTLLPEEDVNYKKIKEEISNRESELKNAGPNNIPRRFAIKEALRCTQIPIKYEYYYRGFVIGTVIKAN